MSSSVQMCALIDPSKERTSLRGRGAMVKRGDLPSLALTLTHKPVFTLGKRGEEGDILERDASSLVTARGERIEVVRSNRGGEVTYHGPGQLVVYPIVDLRRFDLGARR